MAASPPPGRHTTHASERAALRLALVLVLVFASPAAAGVFVFKDWEDLVAEAEQIFVGTVTSMVSRKIPAGAIVTDVTFASPRVLKGGESGVPLSLRVAGGTVGSERMALAGVPTFRTGVTYLVFAKGNGDAVFPVVGGDRGLFQVRRDEAGEVHVLDARGRPLADVPVTLAVFVEAIEDELKR